MTWTTGLRKANGITLHYRRTGGDKPPLVLLHGLTGSGACWAPLARALERDYDLVMPDARGHGQSDTPARGCRYQDLAADVVELIGQLGLTQPVLLGHSMGGMTAALVASRGGGLVRGAVLGDPTFLNPQRQHEVFNSDVAEQHRRLLCRNKDDVLEQLRSRHPHRSPEILALLAEARRQTRMEAFDVLTPPNPDYRKLAGSIGIPTLLLIGDRGVVSADTARTLRDANPNIRVEQLANTGHGLHYDRPERVAARVRAFLETLGR